MCDDDHNPSYPYLRGIPLFECSDEFEKVPDSSNTTYETIVKNDTSIGDELMTVKNRQLAVVGHGKIVGLNHGS